MIMKNRFCFPLMTLLLAALVSCQKDALYLQLPGTCWALASDTQEGFICFHDADNASVLQMARENGLTQTQHGKYTCDGHKVVFTADSGGSVINLVRTFTHLKNSKNKNLSPVKPASWDSMEGSIWATIVDNNLHIAYFPYKDSYADITYRNITRVEGVPYGWDSSSVSYELNGAQLQTGKTEATLFDCFWTSKNNLASVCLNPGQKQEKCSPELLGTVWTYNNTGYPADTPGVIIFHSPDKFTRIMGKTIVVFETTEGTYSLSGNRLEMTIGGKKESCLLSENSFTLFERKYKQMKY